MKTVKRSNAKSSIVDDVQKNMDNASATSIDSASWYREAFEMSSKQDLNWDAAQDTLKALEELRIKDKPIRIHS